MDQVAAPEQAETADSLRAKQGDLVLSHEKEQADIEKRSFDESAPIREGIKKSSNELLTEVDKSVEQKPLPENTAKHIDPKVLNESAQTMMALGAFMGLFARQPFTAALGNMSAAIEGVKKGDEEQYNKAMEEYKVNFDAGIKANKQLMDKRKEIIDDKQLDLTTRVNLLHLMDVEAQQQIKNRDMPFKTRMKMMDDQIRAVSNAEAAHEKLVEQHENRQADIRLAASLRQSAGGETIEPLTPEGKALAARMTANRIPLPGGWSKVGMSRGNTIINEMAKEQAAGGVDPVTQGASYHANQAALTQITKDITSIKPYKEMLDGNANILKDLATKIIKTDAPLANKTVNWLQTHAGDNPDVRDFLAQMKFVQIEGARLITNPRIIGQMTDSARQEIESVIDGSFSLNSTNRVIDRLTNDAGRRVKEMEKQRASVVNDLSGSSTPTQKGKDHPTTNAKGWKLHTDASGNKAYVGPNGEVEEVD